jgi:hypothetical protein
MLSDRLKQEAERHGFTLRPEPRLHEGVERRADAHRRGRGVADGAPTVDLELDAVVGPAWGYSRTDVSRPQVWLVPRTARSSVRPRARW